MKLCNSEMCRTAVFTKDSSNHFLVINVHYELASSELFHQQNSQNSEKPQSKGNCVTAQFTEHLLLIGKV